VVTAAYIFLSVCLRWWGGDGGLQKEISLSLEELEFAQLWTRVFSHLHWKTSSC